MILSESVQSQQKLKDNKVSKLEPIVLKYPWIIGDELGLKATMGFYLNQYKTKQYIKYEQSAL